eukprot:gnl/TRDRNA2_/TRDRNA2_191362_c0_seq1.p1 gnl/TRDRNA2_/TRDRNA2_191362_c0~~gnl/TRDRNA2_/TRDRNA2_191362_c0_seq1.p1  ORF type:complete len:382 (-),score=79.19 gnl/TRDRNA2_/TRDRNA2_191362_c0_seq1:324-1469(-)
MRSCVVHTLLALAMQANARELVDESADMHSRLLDRAIQEPSAHDAELDMSTLLKPGHLSMSRTGTRTVAMRGTVGAHQVQGWPRGSASAINSVQMPAGFAHKVQLPEPSHRLGVVARFKAEDQAADSVATGDEFEVEQAKPLGLTLAPGADGGIYVSSVDKSADPRIQVGDQLLAVSAPFGDEIWPAGSFAQTEMSIKTRIGDMYMKLLSRGGDTDVLRQTRDKSSDFAKERLGGNYGAASDKENRKRYAKSRNVERERFDLFDNAMEEFKAGNYEKALNDYSLAKALEPKNFMGDDFSRYTDIYRVASFNIACCYSKLNQPDAGLEALRDALHAGFDDFKMVRNDPNLEVVRDSPNFKELIDQYDEPIFNTEVFSNFFKR